MEPYLESTGLPLKSIESNYVDLNAMQVKMLCYDMTTSLNPLGPPLSLTVTDIFTIYYLLILMDLVPHGIKESRQVNITNLVF